MKRTAFSLSAAFLLSGMLVGCGANNNGAVGNRNNNDGARPIGYYTGNGRDNLPGIRDNNLSDNNNTTYQNRLNNDRDNDLGFGNGVIDNDGPNDNNGPNANGTVAQHERQAKAIANRVADLTGVENTSVVVTDDNVLVGVRTNNQGVTRNLKSNIRRTAQTVVRGKDIHVTTDRTMYNRIKNVSNNLRDGDTTGEVSSDVRGIINDIANAAKRPFQNNNR